MTSQQNGEVTSPPKEDTAPHLDLEKLHALPSEQQDLSLLTFSAELVRHVASLDHDASSRQQAAVKKELLEIVTLTSPTPTRIIRNNLGVCFRDLFG